MKQVQSVTITILWSAHLAYVAYRVPFQNISKNMSQTAASFMQSFTIGIPTLAHIGILKWDFVEQCMLLAMMINVRDCEKRIRGHTLT